MARQTTKVTRGGDGTDNEDFIPADGADQLNLGPDVALVGDPGDNQIAVEGGEEDPDWDLPEGTSKAKTKVNGNGNEQENDAPQFDAEDSRNAYSEETGGEEDATPRGMSHRQRRNARRKVYLQTRDADNEALREQVNVLQAAITRLASGQQGLAVGSLESQITTLQGQLRMVDEEMAKSVASSDGETYDRAQKLRDTIIGRLYTMRQNHARLSEQQQQDPPLNGGGQVRQQDQQQQQPQRPDPRIVDKFERFRDRFEWFDPNSRDANSNIVRAIDQELSDEGYQRHSTQFWQELERRMATDYGLHANQGNRDDGQEGENERPGRQPQREAPMARTMQRPPTNGGRSTGSGRSAGFRLDEIQTNILREEGLLEAKLSDEDKAKRDRIIGAWKKGANSQRRGTMQ